MRMCSILHILDQVSIVVRHVLHVFLGASGIYFE